MRNLGGITRQVKKVENRDNLYYDANGVVWEANGDYFYAHDRFGEAIQHSAVASSHVDILSQGGSSRTAITDLSPSQKEKGMGIINEREKVIAVLDGGDCSDGGSEQVDWRAQMKGKLQEDYARIADCGG